MKKQTLRAAGIKADSDIPVGEIISPFFDFSKYGLDESARPVMDALLSFVKEFNAEAVVDSRTPVRNSVQAIALMCPVFKGLDHEELWGLFLDSASKPLGKVRLSGGNDSSVGADMRSIIVQVLRPGVRGVVILHNHPFGDCLPSQADINWTGKLKKALSVFDIKFCDHVILGQNGSFYSFAEDTVTNSRPS